MPHRLTDRIGIAHHSLITRHFTSILFPDLVRGPGLDPIPTILCRRGSFQGSSPVGFIHEGRVGSGGVGAWCGGAGRGGQEWGAVTRPRNELTMEVHPTVPKAFVMTI